MPVSGSLVSYSGHNLTGARIRVKVTCYGDGVYDQEVPVEEGNTFKTSFKATTSGYYRADVTVTEATAICIDNLSAITYQVYERDADGNEI